VAKSSQRNRAYQRC